MLLSNKPNILVLPKPSLYRRLFAAEANAELRSLGQITFNDEERNWSSDELAERIVNSDIVITGWGSPAFTDSVLDAATRLKLVAHSAGSIKFMFAEDALHRGFAITCVAPAM